MSRTHRRHKRRNWGRTLLLLVFLFAALYAGAHCMFRAPEQAQQEPGPTQETEDDAQAETPVSTPVSTHYVRKEDFYTILVSGVDDGNGGSDTNILVALDAANNYIYGVSIPRDTTAYTNGKHHQINAAYNPGGMELSSDVVSEQ